MALYQTASEGVNINLFTVNSEKWTFQDSTVRSWVEDKLTGKVLNACAGETRLSHTKQIHRNDVNTDRPADTHRDLRELPNELGEDLFDVVVYDPPWSVFQVNDKYEGRGQDTIKQSTQMAHAIDTMLKPGGKVLCFGYTINMIPTSFDYELNECAVFTIPGPGKDFFGSVHMNNNMRLTDFS
jgi:hypothetical protein